MANPITEYLSARYAEVGPLSFYRDLFPAGSLAPVDDCVREKTGTYSAIAVRVWKSVDVETGSSVEKAERHLVLDPLDNIERILTVDGILGSADVKDLLSPVSYAGRRPLLNFAHELFALVFDVDSLKVDDSGFPCGLDDLIFQMSDIPDVRSALLPMPTYIVSSGTGIHLYYLLEEPVRLWPNVIQRLSEFRYEFTKRCWNAYVTELADKPQFESVVQSFRMVGSTSKSGDQIVRAFKTGERVSMEHMNSFVPPKARLPYSMWHAEYTIAEANEKWPEWDPNWRKKALAAPGNSWAVNRAVYDWWCRRVESGEPFEGNRYWCIFVAACYAAKCPEVSYEELEEWAYRVRPMLDSMTRRPGNAFTVDHVADALAAYGNPISVKLRAKKIAEKTSLPMPSNKRNWQDRRTHLWADHWVVGGKIKPNDCKIHREFAFREAVACGRIGAPTKCEMIRSYAYDHPEANHTEIARALNVSRPTVIKWLRPGWREEWCNHLAEVMCLSGHDGDGCGRVATRGYFDTVKAGLLDGSLTFPTERPS